MRILRLAAAERAFLRSARFLPQDLLEVAAVLSSPSANTGDDSVALEDEVAERFRDIFTEQLARGGFDAEYRLTAEGAMLERLIDAFAP
jgi:hypothetical protein